MTFSHAQAVRVFLWGRAVGTISPWSGTRYRFVYDSEFLASGLQIAPFELPLQSGEFVFPDRPPNAFYGMPAVFADSLPDDFGNSVIDAWMERAGVRRDSVTPLDRLVYVGSRGMGALAYEPDRGPRSGRPLPLALRKVVEESRQVLGARLESMSAESALREIFRVGTSAGGAQAKAVVGYDPKSGRFCLPFGELPEGYEHWIVKITPPERPYAGRAEYQTYEKAVACGIEMSESRLFDLDGVSHFMTRRFDREGSKRHHLITLRALLTLPPDVSLYENSYSRLFDAIDALHLGYESMEQMFRRMAFNVYADESDDHSKNFSFMMKESTGWQLAPAYDLTGGVPSEAASDDARRQWTNCHALSINGKQSDISDDDLLAVAGRYGIGTAPKILKEIKETLKERKSL